jgi:hypothetical protein
MYTVMKLLTALVTLVAAAPALAEDTPTGRSSAITEPRPAEGLGEQKPSVGLMLGYADTEAGRTSSFGYGLEYAVQPYIPFGAAVELSGYSADGTDTQPSITRTKLLFKGNYNFGGDVAVIKDSYVGVGIGPVWDNILGRSQIDFGIAPQVGFDIPLNPNYTLGANANYLFVGGAKPDAFALNGVAKYWF